MNVHPCGKTANMSNISQLQNPLVVFRSPFFRPSRSEVWRLWLVKELLNYDWWITSWLWLAYHVDYQSITTGQLSTGDYDWWITSGDSLPVIAMSNQAPWVTMNYHWLITTWMITTVEMIRTHRYRCDSPARCHATCSCKAKGWRSASSTRALLPNLAAPPEPGTGYHGWDSTDDDDHWL